MMNSAAEPFWAKLHIQIFAAMALGILAGWLGGPDLVPKVGWLGTVFVSLLKMIIVPLVVFSIINGVASVGAGAGLGRLFGKTLGYYFLSSLLAILVGLFFVNVIQPGVGADLSGAQAKELPELTSPTNVGALLLEMVPTNVAKAAADADMLGVIFFCILFGLAITAVPKEPQRLLVGFFDAAFQVMMKLTGWIIRVAPIGVFGLMVKVVGSSGFEAFRALAMYMVTIASGLTVHMFITLPLLLILLGRIDPRIHFRNMIEPLTMAFSTSSSGATLPVTLRTVREKVGASDRVTSFVLPMGATVNMDGTALYECAGALFIAQVLGADLSVAQQGIVVLTALLASIGAAAVPSAGLVIIFLVTEAVGLRGPQVELIIGTMFAIDRPLDMYRTAVNVFSDSCGAAIIARSEGESDVDT